MSDTAGRQDSIPSEDLTLRIVDQLRRFGQEIFEYVEYTRDDLNVFEASDPPGIRETVNKIHLCIKALALESKAMHAEHDFSAEIRDLNDALTTVFKGEVHREEAIRRYATEIFNFFEVLKKELDIALPETDLSIDTILDDIAWHAMDLAIEIKGNQFKAGKAAGIKRKEFKSCYNTGPFFKMTSLELSPVVVDEAEHKTQSELGAEEVAVLDPENTWIRELAGRVLDYLLELRKQQESSGGKAESDLRAIVDQIAWHTTNLAFQQTRLMLEGEDGAVTETSKRIGVQRTTLTERCRKDSTLRQAFENQSGSDLTLREFALELLGHTLTLRREERAVEAAEGTGQDDVIAALRWNIIDLALKSEQGGKSKAARKVGMVRTTFSATHEKRPSLS